MSSPQETKQYILTSKPTDYPVFDGPNPTFTLKTSSLPSLSANQVLLKTLFLSNDPAQRGWIQKDMDPARLYVPPVPLNEPMRARGIAKVMQSKSDKIKEGALVIAGVNWQEYCVIDASQCQSAEEIPDVPITAYLGALGLTGFTAYYGLLDVARAAKDDVVVISGAAGATGQMAVQIAKHMVKCKRVIGIAGSDDKCKFVKDLGADVCLNYKKDSFEKDLVSATEGFVDVYFDNVGGKILDLLLTRMGKHGRIAACGAISSYNDPKAPGLKNWFEVISNRIEIKGFIVMDSMPKWGQMREELLKAAKEGTIKVSTEQETVVETKFEDIPKTWMKLFDGSNTGKLVTKLVE